MLFPLTEMKIMSAQSNADQKLTMLINNKMAMRGIRSPCRVTVTTSGGQVTLSGTVAQAHQKSTAVSVANGVTGVKRVIDQLTIKPAEKRTQ